MFRPRDPQSSLFAASMLLTDDKRKRLERDWPGEFRRSVLPLIDEELFRDLYCADNGRPNKPVQTIVALLILALRQNLWVTQQPWTIPTRTFEVDGVLAACFVAPCWWHEDAPGNVDSLLEEFARELGT